MIIFEDFSIQRSFSDASAFTLFTDSAATDESVASGTGTCPCGGFCADNAHASNTDPASISYVTDYTALLNPNFYGDFSRWNGDVSGAAMGVTYITYTFTEADELPDPANVARTPDSVFSFTEDQRAATRLALEEFSKISGIVFIEVEGDSMMDFLGVTGSGVGGYAFYPFGGRSDGGGVYIEGTELTDFSVGTGMFQVILHEIGHAVGLKHPFEGDIRLEESVDKTSNTVMSYTWEGIQTVLPALDYDAIQFLYGTPEDSGKDDVVWQWDEENDIFTVTGTDGDDEISGVNFQNIIDGGAGDDVILGGGANDTLTGGAGNDRLVGSNGDNTLDGGAGNDIIVSAGQNDVLIGGEGDDTFLFEYYSSATTVSGGDGFDIVSFTGYGFVDLASNANISGIEEFRAGQFNISLYGDENDNRFIGAAGDDFLVGREGDDYLIGGGGDDKITGGTGADYLDGGDGHDTLEFDYSSASMVIDLAINTISGGDGEGDTILNFESVRAGGGDDTIFGTSGDNTFFYYGGSDTYDGRGGSDTLSTEFWGDFRVNLAAQTIEFLSSDGNYYSMGTMSFTSIENIITGRSNDVLIGNDGDNILNGNDGNDELTGGGGGDTFMFINQYNQSFGNDIITDFVVGADFVDLRQLSDSAVVSTRVVEGNIVIDVATNGVDIDSSITFLGVSATEWSRQSFALATDFVGTSSDDFYNGTASGDLALGLGGADTLNGGLGADEIYGGAGNDILLGGDQNDNLYGGDGDDQVLGQRGADFLYGGAGNDLVLGGNRNDRLFGEDGNDRVFGGNDQDVIDGGAGIDIGRGGNGDDVLNGGDDGDVLFGGTGRDTVSGDGGNDVLFGRGGFDILIGGAGDDTLEGGLQADQFIFADGFGNDVITDFASLANGEKIHLTDVTEITDFQDLIDNHMNQVGADVVIADGLGNTITLQGVQLSDLDAVDFVF